MTRDAVGKLLHEFAEELDLEVSQDASVPRYHRIARVLMRFIEWADLKSGTLLPSEEAIGSVLGASRPTVNKAIDELAVAGWVVRKAGQGSSVHRSPRRVLTYLSPRLTLSDLQYPDSDLASTVVQRKTDTASEETAQLLGLQRGAPVFVIRRLFFFRGSPVLLVDSKLSALRFPGLLEEPLATGSVLAALRERYQCRIRYSEWGCEAGELLERDLARLLRVPLFTPVLLMSGVRYAERGEPIEEYKSYVTEGVCIRAVTHHDWLGTL